MNKSLVIAFTVCLFSCFIKSYSQDFSNKGKDFWVGYGYHQIMTAGNNQEMVLYFATDAITTVKVEIPLLGYSKMYTIAANTIFTSDKLPKSGAQNAILNDEKIFNTGIHITSDKPIVAYAHIYNASVSGATLLFPTPTLGKEYYSINYDQISNSANANCWAYVIAVDTGITTVEIIPSAPTQTHLANVPFTVDLKQGQIYNLMGLLTAFTNPFKGVDLTGTKIRSVTTVNGNCKRLAVFSGSGRISVTCPNITAASSDNYMVQAFPKNAWGKKYLTAPTSVLPNNMFRICVDDPTTVVKINGVVQTNLINNFYYNYSTTQPASIEADKPIMVAQIITSQGACGNGSPGDPEVIYLSSVEQNIEKVILNSTRNYAILQHWINVVIRSAAVASFKLDGLNRAGSFSTHPQDPAYKFAQFSVDSGQHILSADSGFNAIAYGLGNAESYGYNAGTNVKDLYQFVSLQNQYATVNFPAACKSTPFYFSMTFPYQPRQIKWLFNGLFADVIDNNPKYDSTWSINGKQLYLYKLRGQYLANNPGNYPIKVVAINSSPEGCSGEQVIDYELVVAEQPAAHFTYTTNGCVSDSVHFTDLSNTNGRGVGQYLWNFGDGTTSSLKNPVHQFAVAGNYTVTQSVITDVGCLSDQASKNVNLSQSPVAKFAVSGPFCIGNTITYKDSSTSAAGNIIKWYWNFGDGSAPVIATSNASQTHTYSSKGIYKITLQVETAGGCKSGIDTLPIPIESLPLASFNFGNGCLPSAAIQFTNTSTNSDSTPGNFTYAWNFGDGGASDSQNPIHTYTTAGPFYVNLKTISSAGCIKDTSQTITTIYPQPKAYFSMPLEVCLGNATHLSDSSSTAPNSTIAQWVWTFDDNTTSNQQNPVKTFATAGSHAVNLKVISAIGCASPLFEGHAMVNVLPVSHFTISASECEKRPVTFSDHSISNATSIVNRVWDVGDGPPFSQPAETPFTHTYATAANYPVSLRVTNDKGCTNKSIDTAKIHALPAPGFIMPENCSADPFSEFIDTTHLASGSIINYAWTFGDANATPTNPNAGTGPKPRHSYIVTGTYDVQQTVTSDQGCTAATLQHFTINGAYPHADFNLMNASLCSNDSVVIKNNSTVLPGRIVRIEIIWNDADSTDRTVDEEPFGGKTYAHKYPEFFSPATKNYTVTMKAFSGQSCVAPFTQTITMLATPDILFDTLSPVCGNVPSFKINANATNINGNGVFTGSGVSPNGLFNPAKANIGADKIHYQFTGANGCFNYKEQIQRVYAVPTVDAGPDKFILEGGTDTLQGKGSGINISYAWSPAIWLSKTNIPTPKITPLEDQLYQLTVTSAEGCKVSDEVLIKVLKTPTIPNVFTPNGDGRNDKWEIQYIETYPGATVEIYNRYGQLVFQSKGYGKPWDGTYNGKELPVGTYYYIINPKNGRKPLTGFVDLIR